MKDWKKEMDLIYHLFEQEVANYRQLIEEIKKEAKCLRAGETDALIQSVQEIDGRIKMIQVLEEQIEKTADAVLSGLGKDGTDDPLACLITLLPPTHQSRLSSYQKNLTQLKAWARQINDQNTAYIHDYMDFLSNLISPLVGRWKGSTEYPGHKPLNLSPSYAFNQEV